MSVAILAETVPKRIPGYRNEHRCGLRIAGISIGITADGVEDVSLSGELDRFRIEAPNCGIDCDIEISVAWKPDLRNCTAAKIFDSGSLWTLHRAEDEFIFDFVTPVFGTLPYKRLCVNKGFSQARILLNRKFASREHPISAMEYPVDELLVTNWLALGRGVEVHGCGMVDRHVGIDDRAFLFLGHSGAGKSTTSHLWSSLRDVHILSDDRIILREREHEVWMHGTPWHGEAGFASPGKAKIHSIFILEHAEKNEVIPLGESQAVAELFARCFAPFHGHAPLESTLCYLQRIAKTVPCYKFRFLPNATAVETILGFDRHR